MAHAIHPPYCFRLAGAHVPLAACMPETKEKKEGGRGAVSCEQVVPGYRSLVSCSAQCRNKVGMLH